MATFTFTTTTYQDAALARHLEIVNEQLAGDGQPPIADVNTFVLAQVSEILAPLVEDYLEADASEVGQVYKTASEVVKAGIRSDLGL
jgi:hypothetical protein|tara:strand:- start:83 stop:343 length:261 start_codon:yes stop_codon:yes gene_type:complete